ncbi:MAG TPA: glycosyltransferase [Dermatophilaceae bacterium]|nr:glycosyltransferase [Dermatophilaceae bacterium]
MSDPSPIRVAAVVPCRDETDRVAATVAAVRTVPGVDLVVVVDDGSTDRTADVAESAGATVVRHGRNAGKAGALSTGVGVVRALDEPDRPRRHLLFVDGDLQETAANLVALVEPVAGGTADMAVATLPPQRSPGGGRGRVVRLARAGIEDLTGFRAAQPLSGMRCLTADAFEAATPLAGGWGVEVGLTVDVLRAGMRVVEVPCDLQHRVSGADWRGRLHRAEQLRDVAVALARRRVARRVAGAGGAGDGGGAGEAGGAGGARRRARHG